MATYRQLFDAVGDSISVIRRPDLLFAYNADLDFMRGLVESGGHLQVFPDGLDSEAGQPGVDLLMRMYELEGNAQTPRPENFSNKVYRALNSLEKR